MGRAEIARVDRAFLQRRLVGRSGAIRSGIAPAVAQGEAIIRGEAQGKRVLRRNPSGPQADGHAQSKRPQTNPNHNFSSFRSTPPRSENAVAPPAADAGGASPGESARPKPANQWSRQELDALFPRRTGTGPPAAESPDTISNDGSSNKRGG
jgi:hypothetical protein